MTEAPIQLVSAQARANRARARLNDDVSELRARLDPEALTQAVKRQAANATNAATRAGANAVRRNPGATAGALAAIVLLLARRPIARLFRRPPKPYVPATVPPTAKEAAVPAPITERYPEPVSQPAPPIMKDLQ